MGKAGGYAIQGLGATIVERIRGCYYNVVGLPIVRLVRMMRAMHYPFEFTATSRDDAIVEKGER